jgi:hypothetical protein
MDWEATAKIGGFFVSFAALGLSTFSLWRQRNRVSAQLFVENLHSSLNVHHFKVTVTNCGNAPFSIVKAYHSKANPSSGKDAARVFYECSTSEILSLQPGNMIILEGHCSGLSTEAVRISIQLHNRKVVWTTFYPCEQYPARWITFMLATFRSRLPEHEVSYWEAMIQGAKCRGYNFRDKRTDEIVCSIRGQNPIPTSRLAGAIEIDEGFEAEYVEQEKFLRLVAERIPELFELDSGVNGVTTVRGGKIALVLRYTKDAAESYAGRDLDGGERIFDKMGFDPAKFVPPRRLP